MCIIFKELLTLNLFFALIYHGIRNYNELRDKLMVLFSKIPRKDSKIKKPRLYSKKGVVLYFSIATYVLASPLI